MYNNYDYPCGADTPDAPYNQDAQEPIDVNCYISCSLSKDVTVTTSDYIAEKWEDWDMGAEGDYVHTGGVNYDYSNCNFNKDYHCKHYGILELLEQLKVFLQGAIKDSEKTAPEITVGDKATKRAQIRIYKQMLEDCQGWTIDEEEVGEA